MLVRSYTQTYTVTGIKASTGRSNKRKYKAKTPEDARILAEQDGITPETIVKDEDREPTEGQISYATGLGVSIPPGCTFDEISDLIDNAVYKRKPADARTLGFADRYGVEYTQYTSKQNVFMSIHWKLRLPGNELDLIAWFLFRVHRHLVHGNTATQIQGPDHPGLRTVAEHLLEDPKFLESIRKNYAEDTLVWFGQLKTRDGETVSGASTKAYAYRIAKNAVSQWVTGNEAPAPRNKPQARSAPPGKRAAQRQGTSNKTPPDTTVTAMLLLAIVAAVVWAIFL
jgi:hypothetical protein